MRRPSSSKAYAPPARISIVLARLCAILPRVIQNITSDGGGAGPVEEGQRSRRNALGAVAWLPALVAGFLLVQTRGLLASPPISLELNKLEMIGQPGPGCRAYFIVQNSTPSLEQLRLDLVIFGTDGVIARRLAFELGPLPAGKTAVRLFDLQGLACDAIGRVLVNDILACQPGDKQPTQAEQDREACLDRLSVSSRIASVPLVK